MKTRLSVLLLFALLYPVFACRIILPPHPPHPPHHLPHPPPALRPMEVRRHAAEIDIRRGVASVSVEGIFHNPNSQRIEGTYLFPIHPRAAVSSFSMTVNGKTMEAELLEAGKARQIYEDIVRQVKDPALLEYADQGLLKARVFPIEPNSEVKVNLVYEEAIVTENGTSTFSYPLLSVKPDAGVDIAKLDLTVAIHAGTSLKTIYTPGFGSDIVRKNSNEATITYADKNVVPSRDFTVFFREDKKDVGIDFLAFKKNGQGYFMLAAAPDSELQMEEIAAKEITFVIDTSGSMAGDKMRQAKSALKFCIENLADNDFFNIVAFSTDVTPFRDQPVPFTPETRAAAIAFVDELKARGGTAIQQALATALAPAPVKDKTPMLVFLTDGLPTIGETNPEKLLKQFADTGQRRLYNFGVGYDVNTRLLDGLSISGGGYSCYVRPEEDLELALSSFYEKIAFPVLNNLKLEAKGFTVSQVNPRPLPGLFKGGQLIVTGTFEGDGKQTLVLSGEIDGTRENFSARADLQGDPQNTFIPRLWAMGQVAYLQDQIRAAGGTADPELVREIKLLGREFGILTEYTSFLVVEQGMRPELLQQARRNFEELEAGVQMDSGRGAVENARLGNQMRSKGMAMTATAPSAFLRESKSMADTFQASGLDDEAMKKLVRQIDDKTFYFRQSDTTWYDAAFKSDETPKIDLEIVAWSEDFFKLMTENKGLHRYIIGGPARQIIQVGSRNILITAAP